MRKVLILLFLIISLFTINSCKTTVVPILPEYNPIIPSKPNLEEVVGEVPIEVVRNTIELMGYAESLEIVLNSWVEYYNSLRKSYSM